MTRHLVITALMLLASSSLLLRARATAEMQGFTSGWTEITDTEMRDVCPPRTAAYDFSSRCQNVILAWSSGAVDTTRSRLIIWGGGHNDYAGNELYALDVATRTMQRLTDPSPPNLPTNTPDCTDTLADGRPNSRHTYDGIAYIAHADRLFVYGGSLACGPGHFSGDTWTFHFPSLMWQRMDPAGPQPRFDAGVVTAYDPNSGKVYVHDAQDLYAYSFETDSYDLLATDNHIDYHMTAAVDPMRRKLVIIGGPDENDGGVTVYDIGPNSSFSRERWSKGPQIVNEAAPGLAYDPGSDRMVAWNGGDTVYLLDMETRSWSSRTIPGGPVAAPANGTFGRWDYVPALGVFVTVTGVDENAYALRLSGAVPPTTQVRLNGAEFRSHQTLSLGLSAQNPDGNPPLDLHVGAVFPDGQTVVVFSSPGVLGGTGSLAAPASLPRMQAAPPGFQFDAPAFFQFTFPAAGVIPSGVYRVFSALVRPGHLNDNVIDPGDIVHLSVTDLTFLP